MIRSRTWDITDNVYNRSSVSGLPIYFEYSSKYRRVIVVGDGNGFEMRVTYKGLPLKSWSKRYGIKEDAIAWAKAQSANRNIIMGCLIIKEAPGKQLV